MGDMKEPQNQDWLDQVVEMVNQAHPEGRLIVSSGHSPSGTYHIGTLREIMTANAIAWALRRAGRDAEHWDIVDDFDAFRKVPTGIGVPESWTEYIGRPVAVVPDPFTCHPSYGMHFLEQLNEGLTALGVVPDRQISGYENYHTGVFVDQIVLALDKLEEVRSILVQVGGRALDANWAPVQIADEQQNLRNRRFTGWDSARRVVSWRDKAGAEGEVGIDTGEVKLDWRLDWPARWAKYGVSAEPFGRDHATKGGSYDTGRVLVERIFNGSAPYPVPYEFINPVGDTKKMSKSAGNVLTPQDALEVMPPEILRYFVTNSRPSRTLSFDSGIGLYALIDEYTKAQSEEVTTTMAYAHAGGGEAMVARVPFNHLVAVFQAARQDPNQVKDILTRTGYTDTVEEAWPVVERELRFVQNWLEKYAPASVKFAVAETLPDVELSQEQVGFLHKLAGTIEAEKDLNGQGMHDAIYAAAEVTGVKPGQAFAALYRVLLGQDSGPKAGWFLASLDSVWLVHRLKQAR